jgi:YesN/AraC family two-component response regulator
MLRYGEKALEAGMVDYTSKPVHSEQFEATLKHWIARPDEALLVSQGEAHSEEPAEDGVVPLDRSALQSLLELLEAGEPDILN